MSELLIRGRVLTFIDEPKSIDDTASYRTVDDGAVLVRDGKIAAVGDYADIRKSAGPGVAVADHRPSLILPGLIDTHLHFPQTQAIASYGAQLMEWLNTYIFVEEQKFAEPDHAAFIAGRFMDELLANGTTTAVAYCSVHPQKRGRLFYGSRTARHADGRRQGDDGPQCAGRAARHAANGPMTRPSG